MFHWCLHCEVDFLPRHDHYLTKCPCCGAVKDNALVAPDPHGPLLRLAARNRAPWVPRWMTTVSGAGAGGIILLESGHTWITGLGVGVLGVGFGAAMAWEKLKRTVLLEVGQGRIHGSRRLAPWPGAWIPASAVERIDLELAPMGPLLRTVFAVVRGGAKVPLLDDVHDHDARRTVDALEAALRAPAPEALPEVHLLAGEREAHLSWNCGRAVSLDLTADTVRVQSGGAPLELDTDALEAVAVQKLPAREGLERHRLVVARRHGEPLVLVDDEAAREPLELSARELRRVLRLPSSEGAERVRTS